MGDEHDARDTVQEAYTRVLRGIRRFRGDAAFTTWLHRITANCALDVLARRTRATHQQLDALDPERMPGLVDVRAEHDPEHRSCQQADRDRLVAALSELPERLRRAVVLHDVYDLPHDAVAAELGISVPAAKVRLHRGRRRLRDVLYGPGEERARPAAPLAKPAAGAPTVAAPAKPVAGPSAPAKVRPAVLAVAAGADASGPDRRRAARAG